MRKMSIVSGLVIILGVTFSSNASESPKIVSWSNTGTGDAKTAFQVKPGKKITFAVKAQGAEKYRWEADTEVRKGALKPIRWYRRHHLNDAEWREFKVQKEGRGDSFTWTVPGKGIWKIRVEVANNAYEKRTSELIASCAKYWKKDAKDEWSGWMRDALVPSVARKEWIVSTSVVEVKPGESIQKATNSLPLEGGIVRLLPGTHVVKETIVIKRNNLAVVGDRSAIVKHEVPKADLYKGVGCFNVPRGGPYHNITFKGFTTASTYTHSHCRIFLADEVVNFTVEDVHNKSYASSLAFIASNQSNPRYSRNIYYRDNTSAHRAGLAVMFAENVHWINNTMRHSGIDINRNLTHVFVYGNDVKGGSLNIRAHGARYAHIYNNTLADARDAGIGNDGLSYSIIENNVMTGARRAGGIWENPQFPLVGNIYRNNLICACANGVYTRHYKRHTKSLLTGATNPIIVNNTIYNCSGDGIRMTSPYIKLDIRNNIIANNGGYGINYVETKKPTVIKNNNIWKNAKGNYNNTSAGVGDIYVAPLFADPSKGDFHLKSKTGRWDPKTKKWVKDNVQSPCIDAGDPKADFSKEPTPNGGRVNIGAYGNTKKASKSAVQEK